MKVIEAFIKPFKLDGVKEALVEVGGMDDGHGRQRIRTPEGE
jgi:nitrogen regulatory protein PII